MKGYKEEVLKNLGVYELRELARRIGVSSPTTKKRKQLEQEILKISKGEANPVIKKNNKGRPPKSIKKMENMLDVFVPKELLEVTLNKKIDNEIGQMIQFHSNSDEDEELYDVWGYVRKTVSEYYYFKTSSSQECVSIPQEVVNEFGLLEGDKLVAKAKKLPTERYYVLKQILSINGHEPVCPRVMGDIEQLVIAETPIKKLEGVYEGNNVLFINDNLKDGFLKIKEIVSPLAKEYTIVAFAPNISVYTKLLIEKEFDGQLIYSLMEDHPAMAYEAATNAANYVNVLLAEGKKVILVLFDLFGLLSGIETFFAIENQHQTHQERIMATRIVKKMFNFGKVLENKASVTVLANCLMHETEESFYKNELIKSADKILKI